MFAEFDALTGSKIALVDLGARVVRMAYSPTASHVIIAILEVRFDVQVFGRSYFIHLEQRIILYHLEPESLAMFSIPWAEKLLLYCSILSLDVFCGF